MLTKNFVCKKNDFNVENTEYGITPVVMVLNMYVYYY